MNVIATELPGVLIVEPKMFPDARGFFVETYNKERYAACGITADFVQDNLSFSSRGVLRGLHYQNPHTQGKLVYVLAGEVWDVAVDIRPNSPQFGRWTAVTLSSDNKRQFYIPPGFAHGFCVLSETALFTYKCTDLYHPECDGGIRWDDPDIGIAWPVAAPLLSDKDKKQPLLKDVPTGRLPQR
ncbi:MAG: dTDP-4-dehydrorhamnose 3,5-epimerase [Veillonellaceae bacterium]|nr:dTDP-4-dehydrorhamnose 3,5-epimerase [Veillonellaceae bacterium]